MIARTRSPVAESADQRHEAMSPAAVIRAALAHAGKTAVRSERRRIRRAVVTSSDPCLSVCGFAGQATRADASREEQSPTPPAPSEQEPQRTLEAPPPAEELSQRCRCQSVRRDRCEQGEHGNALADIDVLRFVSEASVPAEGGALILASSPSASKSVSSRASARPTNWSSDAAEKASVTLPRSRARRKRMKAEPWEVTNRCPHTRDGRFGAG